jgi:hypothetical protein
MKTWWAIFVALSATLWWTQQPVYGAYEGEVANGQVAIPPPFNPTTLDEETLDSYFLELVEQEGEAFASLARAGGVAVTISAAAYASMAGISEEAAQAMGTANNPGEIIVGWVNCNIEAHNPHKGRYCGTVRKG